MQIPTILVRHINTNAIKVHIFERYHVDIKKNGQLL